VSEPTVAGTPGDAAEPATPEEVLAAWIEERRAELAMEEAERIAREVSRG